MGDSCWCTKELNAMRNFVELKINEGGSAVERPCPSNSDFTTFESRYGTKVPEGLRALLCHSNGGHPELDSIEADGIRWSLSRFYHLGDGDQPGSLSYAATHWRSILGEDVLVFAGDSGGNQFFINLADGSVKICLHDSEMRTITLAQSFEAFIDGLHVDEEMI